MLRARRRELGLTQRELASKMFLAHPKQLGRLERGYTDASFTMLVTWVEALDMHVEITSNVSTLVVVS
jgi:transcriptional regulator with XRE-family HTH domain